MQAEQEMDALFEVFCQGGSTGGPIPFEFFGKLRERGTVVPSPLGDGSVIVLGFDAVSEVFRDARSYSSASYATSAGAIFGHSILEMDAPEHTRYRALVQKAFSRRAVEMWRDRLVVPYAQSLIDGFAARGRAELTREFAFPFPLAIIAGMLDVPEADRVRFTQWAVEILSGPRTPEVAMEAATSLGDYFAPRIEAARGRTGEDVVTLLANVELDGARLTTEEILPFLRLMSPAAFETTARAFSNLMCGLLNHPEQLDAVKRDRRLVPQAVQEGLRWGPPATAFPRVATRDVELHGLPVKAGATLLLVVGAANRDPARWDSPDEFDIHRPARTHIAFAHGLHTCLGVHLATLELETALAMILKRLPELRLDPDAPQPEVTGGFFRTALSLPVVF